MLLVSRAQEAHSLLEDATFIGQWNHLHESCAWATLFQSPAFATAWNRTYAAQAEPLIISARNSAGELEAVWPLAWNARFDAGRRLVAAGGHQAEYQAYLAIPQLAETFPIEALAALWKILPHEALHLRYLPPQMPLGWVSKLADHCLLETCPRPLLHFGDGSEIEQSLKKSGNKSRLRQLKKFGPLHFRQARSAAEIDRALQQASTFHDIRQLALCGVAPFSEDALKLTFHHALAMAAKNPLLHVTTLHAGKHLVSAQVNVLRANAQPPEVQLWLIAHNPLFSAYSPGKLHLLYLAQMLFRQGIEQLDLTPGSEPYKERFANTHDQVHTLSLFPTAMARRVGATRHRVWLSARRAMDRLGMTPSDARCAVDRFKRCGVTQSLPRVWQGVCRLAGWRPSVTLMRYDAGHSEPPVSAASVKRDCLDDLLLFSPVDTDPARQGFMQFVHNQFEKGHHLYTQTRDGKLSAAAWLLEDPDPAALAAELPGIQLPAHTAVILNLQQFGLAPKVYPNQRMQEMRALLRSMLHDAIVLKNVSCVHAALAVDDVIGRHAAASLGMIHVATLHRRAGGGQSSACRHLKKPAPLAPEACHLTAVA